MFTPCTGGDEFSCANFAVALASRPGFGHTSGRSSRADSREGCLTPSGVDAGLGKGGTQENLTQFTQDPTMCTQVY